MKAFDNICIYMCFAGRYAGQGAEFWSALIDYCKCMKEDILEILHCMEFFCDEIKTNNYVIEKANDVV